MHKNVDSNKKKLYRHLKIPSTHCEIELNNTCAYFPRYLKHPRTTFTYYRIVSQKYFPLIFNLAVSMLLRTLL